MYTPYYPSWVDGPTGNTPLEAAPLNNIEQGIVSNSSRLDALAKVASTGSYADLANRPFVPQSPADLGLGNVNNTSDANKPVSAATQTALNAKVSVDALVVNVRDHGAKGDGVTDDTASINTAISTSPAGSVIWFPPGTYLVSSTVVLYPNRTYLGPGGMEQRATILGTSAVTGAIVAAQGWTTNATVCDSAIKMSGLCIQGPGQSTGSAHGLAPLNSWSSFDDLYLVNVAGDGIHLADTTVNGTNIITLAAPGSSFRRCRFDTIGGNGFYQNAVSNLAYLNGQLQDCSFGSIKGDGIQINDSVGWFVQRNHLYGIGGRAVFCDNAYATHVSDNYVEDFGGANTASFYYGVRVLQQAGGWPSLVSGNFVSSQQAGTLTAGATGTSWQNFDMVGKGAGAEVNFVNNVAWKSASAGAGVQTDAFTFEVNAGALVVNAVGNTTGASTGTAFRTVWNVLAGASFANSTVPSVVTPAFAATYTTDCSTGSNFRITLTGNITLANPVNMVDGQEVVWEFIQDATGGRTLTLGSGFVTGSDIGTPTLTNTASKRDYVKAKYDASAAKWHVLGLARGY